MHFRSYYSSVFWGNPVFIHERFHTDGGVSHGITPTAFHCASAAYTLTVELTSYITPGEHVRNGVSTVQFCPASNEVKAGIIPTVSHYVSVSTFST